MTDLIERLNAEAHKYATAGPPHIRDLLLEAADEIAAAQEMLEALQCVLENEASDHKAQEEFGGYVLDDDVRRVVIAAIAKATGAAPTGDEDRNELAD